MRAERVAWVAATLTWLAALGSVAAAHDVDNDYNLGPPAGLETWPGADPVVSVRFAAGEVNAARESAIQAGFNKWHGVGGAAFHFTLPSGSATDYPFWARTDCSPAPNHSIHWDDSIPASTGYVAFTGWCVDGGDITSFATGFDSDTSLTWHEGSAPPSGLELDLRSLAADEAGHATGGWGDLSVNGHFDDSSAQCPLTSSRHTMSYELGTDWYRTLETHDLHTFAAASP